MAYIFVGHFLLLGINLELYYNCIMSTLMQSQVFFFISSIGFVLLWILLAIFLFHLIKITKTFSKIMEKAEKDINEISETTKEMIEDMRENRFFNFFFPKNKKHHKK